MPARTMQDATSAKRQSKLERSSLWLAFWRHLRGGWHGQVLLPVPRRMGFRTGKSTCPCHAIARAKACGSLELTYLIWRRLLAKSTAMDEATIGQTCALLTAVTWASAMVLFKRSGETVPPLALNLFKNVVGLVLIIATLIAMGHRLDDLQGLSGQDIQLLLLSGFIGIAVADTIFLYSLNLVGVGIQSIVDCLYSPFVILFSWLMLAELLTTFDYLGASLILGGVFISARHEPPPGRTRAQLTIGIVLGGFSIALMAIGIVIAKPVLDPAVMDFPLLWATTLRLLAGTVPLALWAAASSQRAALLAVFRPGKVWWSALPGAFLGAYLSMILWVAGFKFTQAGIAAILNQTSTVFAIILAAVFLKERLTARKLVAVVLAMGGVVIVATL